jgi:hypothetical protein
VAQAVGLSCTVARMGALGAGTCAAGRGEMVEECARLLRAEAGEDAIAATRFAGARRPQPA